MKKSDMQILFADDEEMICRLFKEALESWEYTVDVANDGVKAIDMCSNKIYHLLITDLNMPKMDGLSLIKKVGQRWPSIESIIITGYGTVETAIDAMKMGVADFIIKPVNFEKVRITLNRCYQKIKAVNENQELREMNAQLRELGALKDKFLSITSHEIRTPLTIIQGYLEILDCFEIGSDSESKNIIKILRQTTKELRNIIDRMHVLTRANRIGWSENLHPVQLNKLLCEIYQDMNRLFEHRSIQLSLVGPDNPVTVYGTEKGLKIIIRELLQNALKFTPDNGKVSIRVFNERDKIVLYVEDSGIGIPFDKQELVFTDFYEVRDSIHHKTSNDGFLGGGMGIGLSLVKEIVTSLKGEIDLHSEPGLGSSFKIYLPNAQLKKENKLNAAS